MSQIMTSWLSTLSRNFAGIAQRQCLSVTLIGLLGFATSAVVGRVIGLAEPRVHDEFSYLLAADTFAHGRLTNPTHPIWLHLESFHIIQRPSYMSKYPPAQGLMLAAGKVMGGHPIVGVWLSFGIMCAATCWMLHGWVPPRWALYGGLLALINPVVGVGTYWAQSYWGGAIAATGGACVLGGVRRLTHERRVGHALVTGVGLAILANSRPYEGLLLSIPALVILIVDTFKRRGTPRLGSMTRVILPIFAVVLVTAIAMAFFNFRVTGHALRMPYQIYEQTYATTPVFLWQSLPREPNYNHKIIRDFHERYALPSYTSQQSVLGFLENKTASLSWLGLRLFNVFAVPLIGVFTLLLRWTWRNRWAQRAVLIYLVFMAGLLMETFMWDHYAAPVLGLNYFFILSAMRLWCWRDRRVGRLMLWLVALLATLATAKSIHGMMTGRSPSAWHMQRATLLSQMEGKEGKHLIIVSYGSRHSYLHEWVYNEADIDGAKVVWAREMNMDQNCELIEYFKERHIWALEVDEDDSAPIFKPYPTKLCR